MRQTPKHILQDGAGGLKEADPLLVKLRQEFAGILGDVGTNADMRKLLSAAAHCWDWSFLALNKPTKEHLSAFLTVSSMLRLGLSCPKVYLL